MKIVNLEQKSPGWLKWRDRGLGSSDAPLITIGQHFDRDLWDLWQEKVGLKPRVKTNSRMARGNNLEPIARRLYEQRTGFKAEPLSCHHDEHEWLKASLDGWVIPPEVVVEIKAPNKLDHQDALDGRVPKKYEAQLDHQLLVTGGKFAHYVSYSNYFPALEQLAIVRYPAIKERLDTLFSLERAFWDAVENFDQKTPEDVLLDYLRERGLPA